MENLTLSARASGRILNVARTIADLGGAEAIAPDHIAEAVQYRTLERNLWREIARADGLHTSRHREITTHVQQGLIHAYPVG